MKIYRQGDVAITPSLAKKKNWIEKDDKILAHGKVTGHAHRFIDGDVAVMIPQEFAHDPDNATEFEVCIHMPSNLYHEEHEGIVLPVGDQRAVIQREYDWASKFARKVMD